MQRYALKSIAPAFSSSCFIPFATSSTFSSRERRLETSGSPFKRSALTLNPATI